MKLTTSIMASVGRANAASSAAGRGAKDFRAASTISNRPAKNTGPNTPNCETKNSAKCFGLMQRPVRDGVLLGVAVGDEAVAEIPEEIGRVDQRAPEPPRRQEALEMAALVAEQQEIEQRREAANRPWRISPASPAPRAAPTAYHQRVAARLARADEGVERQPPRPAAAARRSRSAPPKPRPRATWHRPAPTRTRRARHRAAWRQGRPPAPWRNAAAAPPA